MAKFGIGQPVRRVEDQRLITGQGRYTDDIAPEGALHAFVLRSPHGHARFTVTDTEAARKLKGVKLILTGKDVAHYGDLPCKGHIKTVSGEMSKSLPVPVLPLDTVRHVGEAVAFIVAETIEQARDAAEAIAIDWEPLPAVNGIEAALVDFAKSARYEETVASLSLLCAVPIDVIDRLMAGDRPDPVLILCKSAGWDWPTARAIIMARPGAKGTSTQGLDSAFSNFERLSPATAQRVMRFWQARPMNSGR